MIRERVLKWLFPVSTEELRDTSIDERFAHIEAHLVDVDAAIQYRSATLSNGPPGMTNLRPGYQSRSSKIAKAQEILNQQQSKDVPDAA
jgi:hypothetical protein